MASSRGPERTTFFLFLLCCVFSISKILLMLTFFFIFFIFVSTARGPCIFCGRMRTYIRLIIGLRTLVHVYLAGKTTRWNSVFGGQITVFSKSLRSKNGPEW